MDLIKMEQTLLQMAQCIQSYSKILLGKNLGVWSMTKHFILVGGFHTRKGVIPPSDHSWTIIHGPWSISICKNDCIENDLCKARNRATNELICDYIDRSTTFNGGKTGTEGMYLKIPGVGQIQAIANSQNNNRDTGVKDLIELVINAWRATGNRVLQVSDILNWAKGNGEVRSKIPKCPWKFLLSLTLKSSC